MTTIARTDPPTSAARSLRNSVTWFLGPASGAVGAALTFAGLMTANSTAGTTSPADAPATIAAAYGANSDGRRVGISLALGGVFFLLWFLGYLRGRIAAAEGANGYLHTVAFGGGLVGAAGVVSYLAVLVASSNSSIGSQAEAASSLLLLEWEYGGVFAPAFGALVGATSLAVIRHKLLPDWLVWIAWLGIPLALGLAFSGFLGGALVVSSLLWLFAIAVAFLLYPGGTWEEVPA